MPGSAAAAAPAARSPRALCLAHVGVAKLGVLGPVEVRGGALEVVLGVVERARLVEAGGLEVLRVGGLGGRGVAGLGRSHEVLVGSRGSLDLVLALEAARVEKLEGGGLLEDGRRLALGGKDLGALEATGAGAGGVGHSAISHGAGGAEGQASAEGGAELGHGRTAVHGHAHVARAGGEREGARGGKDREEEEGAEHGAKVSLDLEGYNLRGASGRGGGREFTASAHPN
mmetsp:Transcript_43726/g.137325  ORF Transcript_43726/g.137325 Transcript_43726/m.137325 type:complete len:229 (-) Transcript_43726:49-735(-)